MKKIITRTSLLVSLFLLSACSGLTNVPDSQPVAKQDKSERIIVISSAKPAKVLPAFTTFSWNDKYNRVLSAADNLQRNQVKASIREQLITYLKTKGYQYQPIAGKADVTIGFLFAIQDTLAKEELIEKFGLPPSRSKNRVVKGYKQGTLFLTVLDTQENKVYWRSMMQGVNGLTEKLENMDSNYLQFLLHKMMGGFPKAGH